MKTAWRIVTMLGLVGVLIGSPKAWADEETVPSFRTSEKREGKEFVGKVGTAIINAARAKPGKIELISYEYTSPKAGRKELAIKMQFAGVVTKVKHKVDVKILIDTSDKEKWEVLNIDYKDSVKSVLGANLKKVQALIKQLNK